MLPQGALSSPGAFKPTVERAPPSPARKDIPLGRTTLPSLFSCHGQGLCLSKNMWGVDCLPKASERVQSEELLCQVGDWRVWGGGIHIHNRAAGGSRVMAWSHSGNGADSTLAKRGLEVADWGCLWDDKYLATSWSLPHSKQLRRGHRQAQGTVLTHA